MPLPEPIERTELHLRRIELRGFRRADGLYEVDGRVQDTKTAPLSIPGRSEPLAAGMPVHDMWIRMVVDEQLVVRDVLAVTDASPYGICREAVAPLTKIVGEQIKPGWTNMVKERLGGVVGCTHLMELLMPMATAAYQTLATVRLRRVDEPGAGGRPSKIDSCYAYASHRAVVQQRWPAFYTGASADAVAATSLPSPRDNR